MNKPDRYSWKILLFPFSMVYGLIVWFRNQLFDMGILTSVEFSIPIISVGNISVGGTGKTPHVEYLIDLLKENYNIATLSRGYKRKTRDFIVATLDSTVKEIGDEPMQIKQKYPELTVAVDRNRVHGVRMLLKNDPSLDLILLDDAYQHRYIKPGFSILLIDYNRPLNKDFLLPVGHLREPAHNRNRANMILVTKSPERLKPIDLREYVNSLGLQIHQHLYFTYIDYDDIYPVFNIDNPHSLAHFKQKTAPVLIVTGIANPRPVKKFARNISTKIKALSFPDHYYYKQKDLERIEKEYRSLGSEDALIITSEKDAMRLQALEPSETLKKAIYSVRIKVKFLNDDTKNFNNQIISYVTSNKRNSVLHKK